ncbi:MAG: chemotaxis protein CheW [Pseudomonadota bacterium]
MLQHTAEVEPPSAAEVGPAGRGATGTFVTFALGNQNFAVDVANVREILAMQPLTHLPNAAQGVEGLIDLRGRAVPVMDLAGRLGMPRAPETHATRLIVCEVPAGTGQTDVLGVVVDRVSEVTSLGAEAIETPPTLGSAADGSMIQGLSRLGPTPSERMTLLLDLAQVFGNAAPGPFDF